MKDDFPAKQRMAKPLEGSEITPARRRAMDLPAWRRMRLALAALAAAAAFAVAPCVILRAENAADAPSVAAPGKTEPAARDDHREGGAAIVSREFSVSGLVRTRASFDAASLAALPAATATVDGVAYTGVALWTLLERVGLVTDPLIKNDVLRRVVVATGSDGYKAVIALGEIDPKFGHAPDLVAYASNGKPLGVEGFARLIAPNDAARGRWVSNLVSLEVVDAASSKVGQ